MNLDCFDNNDIRRMTTMKKYPYTESTDLIIYDQKPKKEKKENDSWRSRFEWVAGYLWD